MKYLKILDYAFFYVTIDSPFFPFIARFFAFSHSSEKKNLFCILKLSHNFEFKFLTKY